MSDNQKPLPFLHPVEKGRLFTPQYDTELADFTVTTAGWTHVCSARFGEGRPCGWNDKTLWTGDSYRYDIFRRGEPQGGVYPQWALRWWNGGGEGWFMSEDKFGRDETCLLDIIAKIAEEPRRWDACHFLWQTAYKTALAAARREEAKYQRAFLEKRLKRVRGRAKGSYRVEIKTGGTT